MNFIFQRYTCFLYMSEACTYVDQVTLIRNLVANFTMLLVVEKSHKHIGRRRTTFYSMCPTPPKQYSKCPIPISQNRWWLFAESSIFLDSTVVVDKNTEVQHVFNVARSFAKCLDTSGSTKLPHVAATDTFFRFAQVKNKNIACTDKKKTVKEVTRIIDRTLSQ